jgi:hypothetical protein
VKYEYIDGMLFSMHGLDPILAKMPWETPQTLSPNSIKIELSNGNQLEGVITWIFCEKDSPLRLRVEVPAIAEAISKGEAVTVPESINLQRYAGRWVVAENHPIGTRQIELDLEARS